MHELLLLVRHQPRKVGLVLGIDTRHQLDVRTEAFTIHLPSFHLLWTGLIRQVTIPGTAEVTITPRPLFLARREVMRGNVQHTTLGVVLIATLKVVLRVDCHITRRHKDVLIVRDIHTCRIVHLIIDSRGDGERRHGSFAMIEDGIDIRWEHALVGIVHLHSRIRPPQESLGQRGSVRYTALNLQIGTTRTKRKARHSLLVEHALHLVHPYRDAAILVLDDGGIHWQISRWTMVLGPVKLNTARNPRARQTHQCRFDDVVIIDKVTLFDFIVRHLDPSTQLWQHHHLDILILQIDGLPLLIHFLV